MKDGCHGFRKRLGLFSMFEFAFFFFFWLFATVQDAEKRYVAVFSWSKYFADVHYYMNFRTLRGIRVIYLDVDA